MWFVMLKWRNWYEMKNHQSNCHDQHPWTQSSTQHGPYAWEFLMLLVWNLMYFFILTLIRFSFCCCCINVLWRYYFATYSFYFCFYFFWLLLSNVDWFLFFKSMELHLLLLLFWLMVVWCGVLFFRLFLFKSIVYIRDSALG